MLSVRGIYENGQIRLLEPVPYLKRVKVIVTIVEDPADMAPPSEEWLFRNTEAFESVQRGLADAAEGRISKLELEELARE